MRRARRVYQAPESPRDTPSVSDTDGIDETRRSKKNANNDPTQPLTGSRQDSAADGTQQRDSADRLARSSSGGEVADDSSVLSRCLCCWRRPTDANRAVGKNSQLSGARR